MDAADADLLSDIRTSYDTVAAGYAELFRDGLAGHPDVRAVLAMFGELVRDAALPVLDAGCGIGLLTAALRNLGVDAFGLDLSPGMLAIARDRHPDLRFEQGSMTDLDLPDGSLAGVLAFYSVIHLPDEHVRTAFGHFHRALRPGGVVLVGFHVGDEDRLKTQGYGGRPMNVHVHLRPPSRVAAWLREAGFVIEAQLLLAPDDPVPGGVVLARRPATAGSG